MNPHEPGSIPVMPSFLPPEPTAGKPAQLNPAADVIRQKLAAIYQEEPAAKEELAEVKAAVKPLSKHQEFMRSLSSSGRPLAEIQTAWHEYYTNLPDEEKHEVWREFYEVNGKSSHYATHTTQTHTPSLERPGSVQQAVPVAPRSDPRSAADIKNQLLKKVDSRTREKAKRHLKSVGFGLMMGSLSVVVLLFGFFNERFIAPFVTPSKSVSSTPIIIDPNNTGATVDNEIVIPKINVEIPVIYDVPTIEEAVVEKGLERGVVHYATTANPGEVGNAVVFGHSSNNILNPGKYKFAFVLLSRLEAGDTFMLTHGGKRYVYKVFDKKIVKPTDVSVLDPIPGQTATATLITCDPPGTSLNRLIVEGQQISPDPGTNTASTAKSSSKPNVLPSNAQSLWQRLYLWLTH